MKPSSQSFIRIAAVGDIIFADQPLCFGFGVRSTYPNGNVGSVLSEEVQQFLGHHDFCIGNFESGIDNDISITLSQNAMSAPSNVISELRKSHFSVLSSANNHTLEHKERGVNILRQCAAANGVQLAGFTGVPCQVQCHNHAICVFSFSCVPDYKNTETIEIWNDSESLGRITNARKSGSIVFVCIHWGSEFIHHPSEHQIVTAHRIIDAGASVVIGTHPHVLQPIEHYHNAVIIYSLGNFITDYYWKPCLLSAIATLTLSFIAGGQCAVDCEMRPIVIDKRTHRVEFAKDPQSSEIHHILENPILPIPHDEYVASVLNARNEYRNVSIRHVMCNLFRYHDLLGFLRWFLHRAYHFIRYHHDEKKNPNAVYS